MNCANETTTLQCSSEGGSIAAGVIFTALIVAGISVAIHVFMHLFFYKPRIGKRDMKDSKAKAGEVHDYEVIYEEERYGGEKKPDAALEAAEVKVKSNRAYNLHEYSYRKD